MARPLLMAAVLLICIAPQGRASDDRPPAPALPERSLPEEQEVLQKWIEASRRRGPVMGTGLVYEYDNVFHAERRGTIRFWVAAPNRWKLDIHPLDAGGNEHLANGVSYRVEPIRSTSVICAGNVYTSIDPASKTYYQINLNPLLWSGLSDDEIQLAKFDRPPPPPTPLRLAHRSSFLGRFIPTSDRTPDEDGFIAMRWAVFPHFEEKKLESCHIQLDWSAPSQKSDGLIVRISEYESTKPFLDLLLNQDTFELRGFRLHDPTGNNMRVYLITSVSPLPRSEAWSTLDLIDFKRLNGLDGSQ